MATVTNQPAKTETKVIEIDPAKVVLELTVEEAQSLSGLLNHSHTLIGSTQFARSDEGRIGPLWKLLRQAGIQHPNAYL